MQRSWVMRVTFWMSGVGALFCAFLLGQKSAEDRCRDGLFDAVNRVAGTQYVMLDYQARMLHYVNPNHVKGNPFCPECYELRQRLQSHSKAGKLVK